MRYFIKLRNSVANLLGVIAIASFACALSSSLATAAQASDPAPSAAAASKLSVEERAAREAWRSQMLKTPAPKQGCHTLIYPNTVWQEVPCRTAPNVPYPMKAGPIFHTVGGGVDYVAQAAGSGAISTAAGIFGSVTDSLTEQGARGASDFSLQLNANQFTTPLCTPPSTNPATPQSPNCMGWQQFVFSNFSNGAFIQYWLVHYFDNRSACPADADVEHGGCCPSGWTAFRPSAGVNGTAGCFRSGPLTAPPTPFVTLTAAVLLDLYLVGQVAAGSDTVLIAPDTQHFYSGSGLGDPLGLNGAWKAVEFAIVGDSNSTNAQFSPGVTFNVTIDVQGPATCETPVTGLTGETNNLDIVRGQEGACCTWTAAEGHGGINLTESNAAGAMSICDAGTHCLPAGAACSATSGLGCCAQFGQHECRQGRCLPVIPPTTCNGKRKPTRACRGSGWQCCGTDGWECGNCQ
jgi:hypothetical protein